MELTCEQADWGRGGVGEQGGTDSGRDYGGDGKGNGAGFEWGGEVCEFRGEVVSVLGLQKGDIRNAYPRQ
jgi:hypothetical protein